MKIKGFTLIELLVVVLVIGILAAVAVPQYQYAVKKSRYTDEIIRIRTAVKAAQLYRLQNGTWPIGYEQLRSMDIPNNNCNSWLADSETQTEHLIINCNIQARLFTHTGNIELYCQTPSSDTDKVSFCKKYTGLHGATSSSGDQLYFLIP